MSFGMWKSYQHYCDGGRPHLVAETIDQLVENRRKVAPDGDFHALIAEAVRGTWVTRGLIRPTEDSFNPNRQRKDVERYDKGRAKGYGLKPGERALTTTEPPYTEWVGVVR